MEDIGIQLHDLDLEQELSFDEELEALNEITNRVKTKPSVIASTPSSQRSGREAILIEALPSKLQTIHAEDQFPSHKENVNAWHPKPQPPKYKEPAVSRKRTSEKKSRPSSRTNEPPLEHIRMELPPSIPRPYTPAPVSETPSFGRPYKLNPTAKPFVPKIKPFFSPGYRTEPRNRKEARYFMHLKLVEERKWSKASLVKTLNSKQRRQAKRALKWRANL